MSPSGKKYFSSGVAEEEERGEEEEKRWRRARKGEKKDIKAGVTG